MIMDTEANQSIFSAHTAIFGATMAVIGALGIVFGKVASIWQGLGPDTPFSAAIAMLTAIATLIGGTCLLLRRTALPGASLLLALGALWLLVVRLPLIVTKPLSEISYQNFGMTSVTVAAAWVLVTGWNEHPGSPLASYVLGRRGRRGAAILFGIALITFGLSHFFYVEFTAPLVPQWLTHPTFWAYFTGVTYLAAGVAIVANVLARQAALLATAQMGGFAVLIWLPMAIAGSMSPFHWTEFVNTCALIAGGWVVTCGYDGPIWWKTPAAPAQLS